MDRQRAIALLSSDNLNQRLQAARYLARFATKADREAIRVALSHEQVAWIKKALRRAFDVALGSSGPLAQSAIPDAATQDEVADDIYAEAVEETTKRLVHELEPILGTLRYYATKEIPEYETSRTRQELDRLDFLLQAIDTLSKAAAPPAMKEFDLAELIESTADSLAVGQSVPIRLAGPRPLIALGDPSLVQIAVANGLRNALEATAALAHVEAPPPVVISWDGTDRDYYVVVLDRGQGLPIGADRIFDIGRTTKKGHLGMGLALADRAARTLKGRIELKPREDGGVSYEFRWPRSRGESG